MDSTDPFESGEIIAEPDLESQSLMTSIYDGLYFLQANAWYFVGLLGICYYVWIKVLSSRYHKWVEDRNNAIEEERMKKDPDFYFEKEKARLAAVKKLQDKYNQDAIILQEVMKQKEEKKRQEWIQKQESGRSVGRKLNQDYNPLMGSNAPTYKAPKRSTCPGGSCG